MPAATQQGARRRRKRDGKPESEAVLIFRSTPDRIRRDDGGRIATITLIIDHKLHLNRKG
jgi:hypothetical protein